MGIIKKQRERVAQVIGVRLANELSDDQLPAILNAIDGSEESVRIVAQQASRDGVKNPISLLMYGIRERRHTSLLDPPVHNSRLTVFPPPPTDSEVEARKQKMREWKKIKHWTTRNRDMAELYRAYCSATPNPTPTQAEEIRREMLDAISEIEEAHDLRQAVPAEDEPEGPAAG